MMKDDIMNCVAVGARHTASVGAVSLSSTSSKNAFVVTGSEDNTLKLWDLPALKYSKLFSYYYLCMNLVLRQLNC